MSRWSWNNNCSRSEKEGGRVKPDIAQYIVSSTSEIFSSMVFLEIVPGQTVNDHVFETPSELSSSVGLAGDIRGLLSVHCSAGVATAITSALLGMVVEEVDDDVKDAIGEIANMIAGGVKAGLSGDNLEVQLTVPTTVCGKALRAGGGTAGTRIVVPFGLEADSFFVEMKYSA